MSWTVPAPPLNPPHAFPLPDLLGPLDTLQDGRRKSGTNTPHPPFIYIYIYFTCLLRVDQLWVRVVFVFRFGICMHSASR